MTRPLHLFRPALLVLPVLLAIGLLGRGSSRAQPSPPTETFDLVLFGDHLRGVSERVELKSNPWKRDEWIDAGQQNRVACTGRESLLVIQALSTAEYLGQDIRENYVALKIDAADGPATLRAAYALPSADALDADACGRLAKLIATDPAVVRRHSLASHARPRPAPLSGSQPFIEHLEAPIRHRKPGVMEVEWLQILFGAGS